ncbi:MAG: hypothetical protein PUE16_02595 [Lactimicrobium massiliense]|jgi:cell division protein FtsB|nr:hypothetical protein [Lactimicrobium massiliense]MDD6726219.1 hypothetical protein [Lactimicrobium massiliense]
MADKSILKKEIHPVKVHYPSKKVMNFVHDEQAKTDRHAIVVFIIFLLFLAVFTKLFVINPLNKVNQLESNYNQMAAQVQQYQETLGNYDSVKAAYDDKAGSFLSDDEKQELNRTDILDMIQEDVAPYVGISSIKIAGAQVSVFTDDTTLDTVSGIIARLQADSRNGYVTVTTTSSSDQSNNDLVQADIEITYGSVAEGGNQ